MKKRTEEESLALAKEAYWEICSVMQKWEDKGLSVYCYWDSQIFVDNHRFTEPELRGIL